MPLSTFMITISILSWAAISSTDEAKSKLTRTMEIVWHNLRLARVEPLHPYRGEFNDHGLFHRLLLCCYCLTETCGWFF